MAPVTVDSTPGRGFARFGRNAGNEPIASWKCKTRVKLRVRVSFTATGAVDNPGSRASRPESQHRRVRRRRRRRALVPQTQQNKINGGRFFTGNRSKSSTSSNSCYKIRFIFCSNSFPWALPHITSTACFLGHFCCALIAAAAARFDRFGRQEAVQTQICLFVCASLRVSAQKHRTA